jgi:hypothetical protein
MRRATLATLAAAFLAGACAQPLPPRLDAERQWARAISDLGMFPIYPPSEDVMVGDAFLHLPDARYFDLVRITTAPAELLARAFCFQEDGRFGADATNGGARGTVRTGDLATPAGRDACAARRGIAPAAGPAGDHHLLRFREAQVPTLDVGRFSQGEIAGAGLFGNVAAALGVGWSSASAVRVELGDLQTLSMDEIRGLELLEFIAVERRRRVGATGRDFVTALTPNMLLRSLAQGDIRNGTSWAPHFCSGGFEVLDGRGIRVVVANRLLFANKVTFDFLSESVGAARAALDLTSVLTGAPPPTAAPAPPAAVPAPAASAAPAEGFEARRAEMLRSVHQILNTNTETGRVTGRITAGRFGTLALERTFIRPAAVGMGAALHFSLADAALPAGEDQIEDVLQLCQATYGIRAAPLQDRLRANLRWVQYLQERRDGMAPANTTLVRQRAGEAAVPGEAPLRGARPLPAFAPRPDIRVRL